MESGDFLSIYPTELKFPFELKKQSSCTLQLTNETNHYIAFKVKTTNPKKYCARPNTGIVLPGTPCHVTVTIQSQKEAPPNMQCKDKFLVQSSVASTGATVKDITSEMFNKEPGKVVKEFKLRVIYVPSNPPSPVPEGSEEGSSPRASLLGNGYPNASLLDAGQQSSNEELYDGTDDDVYETEDSSIDDAELIGQQSSNEEGLDDGKELDDGTDDDVYGTKDSCVDDAELDQQCSNEEEPDDRTDNDVYDRKDCCTDDAEFGQQSSNEEEPEDRTYNDVYGRKDSCVDDAEFGQQCSNKEEPDDRTDNDVYDRKDTCVDDAEFGQQSSNKEELYDGIDYNVHDPKDSCVDDAKLDFRGHAHAKSSSPKPENTRGEIVQFGGSRLNNPQFQGIFAAGYLHVTVNIFQGGSVAQIQGGSAAPGAPL